MVRSRAPLRAFHPLVFFLLFLTLFFFAAQRLSLRAPRVLPDVPADTGVYEDIAVVHIYDGDTIRLANGEKVRFVGVDTPESSENRKLFRDAARSGRDIQQILSMGRRAAEYTKALLGGRRVRLEFDIERRDKYGRLLAYVYRADDGLFVNEALVKNGYAYPMTIPPNIRYADDFRKLFREAQKAKRGLWSMEPAQ